MNASETPASEPKTEAAPAAVVTEEVPTSLEELVKREIEANRMSAQRLCTWGLMGIVFLLCYLGWLYHSVQDNFFNPQVVASFVAGTIEDNLPNVLGKTQHDAMNSAPSQVEAISQRLQGAIPQVRKVAEQQIEEVYLQMPLLRESINLHLKDFFREHQKEMKEFADAHNDEEFVRYFTSHVLSELKADLHQELGSDGEFDLRKVQDQSLGQLVLLNERLKELAEKSPYYMTRRDIVARRLVAVWGTILHETATDLGPDSNKE